MAMLIWAECWRRPVNLPAGVVHPQEKQKFSGLGRACRLLDWTHMFIVGIVFSGMCENSFSLRLEQFLSQISGQNWDSGFAKRNA